MRNKHVDVEGATVTFNFHGKSGVHHTIDLHDRRLARIVQRCHDLPGYELFQYLDDDGNRHTIDSADVNDYLREITGQDFTAKDFRTWAGTVLACTLLREFEHFESDTQAKNNVVAAIKSSPSASATRPPSAASATSIPPSSTPTWAATFSMLSKSRSKRKWTLHPDLSVPKSETSFICSSSVSLPPQDSCNSHGGSALPPPLGPNVGHRNVSASNISKAAVQYLVCSLQ